MKIGLLQLNATVGAFEANQQKLLRGYLQAVAKKAELVVTPELFLSGFPPQDLLNRQDFIDANMRALEELSGQIGRVPLIVGTLMPNTNHPGKPLCNCAVVLIDGEVKGTARKSLLPTYDVFDEDRYFEPGKETKLMMHQGKRIGITICEDIWNDEDFWSHRLYEHDPVKSLTEQRADIILNLAASPWHAGKEQLRARMLSHVARDEGLPVVQVNMIGGNDELLFDGHSMAFNNRGELIFLGNSFEETVAVVDVEKTKPLKPAWPTDEEQLFSALAMGVHDYAEKCGFEKVVIGLSGGIDSAVTACVAVEALGPGNVFGIAMPSPYSSAESIADAETLAKTLEIDFEIIPIHDSFSQFLKQLEPIFAGAGPDVTEENLQARIRGLTLMAVSNKTGRLLLTTGNKSELAVGYCTLYGDMCGGLAVISDVLKTQVYAIARWLNRKAEIIPPNTICKAPSAELRPGQRDQDSLPPYDMLDRIIHAYVVEEKSPDEIIAKGIDEAVVHDVLQKIVLNEYKRRQAAPGLKVSPKAFGMGRRHPIAQRFK